MFGLLVCISNLKVFSDVPEVLREASLGSTGEYEADFTGTAGVPPALVECLDA
jgi:hypothetical protein